MAASEHVKKQAGCSGSDADGKQVRPGYFFRRLGDVALANVAPAAYPLAKYEKVNFAQLHSYQQLLYSPHAHSLPTGEYLQPSQVWLLDSYTLIWKLLEKGLGWAVCPKYLIQKQLAAGPLLELNLEAYPVTEVAGGLRSCLVVQYKNRRGDGVAEGFSAQRAETRPSEHRQKSRVF